MEEETHTEEVNTVQQADANEDSHEVETLNDEVTEDHPTEEDSFPREYVEQLRSENAKYRRRAQQSDQLAGRLHTALTAATGRLQDPQDLPFDDKHLEDPDALNAAIDNLLANKPHLAARRPSGNIGQGTTNSTSPVDLAGILRARA